MVLTFHPKQGLLVWRKPVRKLALQSKDSKHCQMHVQMQKFWWTCSHQYRISLRSSKLVAKIFLKPTVKFFFARLAEIADNTLSYFCNYDHRDEEEALWHLWRMPCTDCGKCNYCLDKPKFGGHATLKQCCAERRCLGLISVGESQGKDIPYLAESLLFVLNTSSS